MALLVAAEVATRGTRKKARKQFKVAQVAAAKQAKVTGQRRRAGREAQKVAAKQAAEARKAAAARAKEAREAAQKAAKQARKDAKKRARRRRSSSRRRPTRSARTSSSGTTESRRTPRDSRRGPPAPSGTGGPLRPGPEAGPRLGGARARPHADRDSAAQPWPAPLAPAPVTATVTVPGSKSETNRALVLAALASGPSTITNGLDSRDTQLMRRRAPGPRRRSSRSRPTGWRVTPPAGFTAAAPSTAASPAP